MNRTRRSLRCRRSPWWTPRPPSSLPSKESIEPERLPSTATADRSMAGRGEAGGGATAPVAGSGSSMWRARVFSMLYRKSANFARLCWSSDQAASCADAGAAEEHAGQNRRLWANPHARAHTEMHPGTQGTGECPTGERMYRSRVPELGREPIQPPDRRRSAVLATQQRGRRLARASDPRRRSE